MWHQPDWIRALGERAWWVIAAGERIAVLIGPSRALPGHLLARVPRLSLEGDPRAIEEALRALAGHAHRHRQLLRLNVELFSPVPARHDQFGAVLGALGFTPVERPMNYTHTIAMDVTVGEERLFESLHATARRHIRTVGKRPVEVRLVSDPAVEGRMNDLLRETMRRTGGGFHAQPWERMIGFANEYPDQARIVGLWRKDRPGSDALSAYALGLRHDDNVEYSVAASAREEDLRMPLGYALAWDLIGWAGRVGARWFDFGGVREDAEDRDPTQGISDFKRYFSTNVIRVGSEWVLEPRPARAAVARAVTRLASVFRRRGG